MVVLIHDILKILFCATWTLLMCLLYVFPHIIKQYVIRFLTFSFWYWPRDLSGWCSGWIGRFPSFAVTPEVPRPRKKRPLQPINDTNMATSRVTSAHARSRVRSRQSLEERVTRHAQQPHTPEVNGVDTDLEKLMISKRQLDFKLDDFEMLNTLGKSKSKKIYLDIYIIAVSVLSKSFMLNLRFMILLLQKSHER